MADVVCPDCSQKFNPKNYVKDGSSAAAGAVAGATLGARIGIVAGPLGGIAGTIPGAIIGGALAYLGTSKVVYCPSCGKVFTI